MNKVSLLVLAGPVERSQGKKRLAGFRKGGIKVALVGEFPSSKPSIRLTRRQTQVLRGMALGYRTKEIAGQLGLSFKTIETYRQQLTSRLGIGHVPGLVRYALQTGVVPASWLLG